MSSNNDCDMRHIVLGFPHRRMNKTTRYSLVLILRLNTMDTQTIYGRFHEWAERQPDAVAVTEDGRSATYPIGNAVQGVEVSILDDNLQEVPDGQTGEICISGRGVSRGYLGDPPEQENFVILEGGARMYRSGDLGYRLPDGNIVFLRRKDRQVMILGKRVEPEEVENVLNESPCVERGVVRAFTDEQGLAYLTAYFVPSHKNCQLSRIKRFLRSRLADFMVPEFFVKMDEIPLTCRGKVNNNALPVVMKEGRPE